MDYKKGCVRCSEFEMEYIRFGSGSNTLVIIPGLSIQSVLPAAAAIVNQYKIFCSDYTVYLFDRRLSLPESYSIYDMAEDTAEVMTELGIKNACVFGTSQGGMIAMALTAKHPELVKKLALGSAAARVDKSRGAVISEWMRLAKDNKPEELYLSFGEKVYPKSMFTQYRDIFCDMAKTVTENDLKRFVTLAEGTDGFDISRKLKDITCPVLAIGDNGDEVLGGDSTPELAELMKNRDNFSHYMYSGYGHAAYDTAEDYAQRLYAFFGA